MSWDILPKAKLQYLLTRLKEVFDKKVGWESNSILGAKNLLPLTLDYLKTINTEGTWNDNVYTLNGITFTVNGGSNVTDITVSGTPITTVYENIFYCTSSYTEGVYFYVPQSARYTLSGCPSGGSAYVGNLQDANCNCY